MKKTLIPQFSISWEITNACDLRCLHCPANSSEEGSSDLPTETCLAILDKILRFGSLGVFLEGGDPFKRKDCLELIDYALKRFIVVIYSNGTLLNRDIISSLSKARNLGFLIELQGASPITHETVVGVSGSYEKTIESVKALTDAGITVALCMTLTKLNVHEVSEYARLAFKLGVKKVKYLRFTGAGRGKNYLNELLLSRVQIEKSIDLLRRLQSSWKGRVQIDYSFPPFKGNCCGTFFTITAEGKAIPCSYLRIEIGDVLHDNIEDIVLQSQNLRSLKVPDKCSTCNQTNVIGGPCGGGCRGAAYNLVGTFDAPDPACLI